VQSSRKIRTFRIITVDRLPSSKATLLRGRGTIFRTMFTELGRGIGTPDYGVVARSHRTSRLTQRAGADPAIELAHQREKLCEQHGLIIASVTDNDRRNQRGLVEIDIGDIVACQLAD
jgi:hypothetical protein